MYDGLSSFMEKENDMRACTMASGGVMFIPDEIERCTAKEQAASAPVSYQDLIRGEAMQADQPEKKKPLTQRIWAKLKKAA